MRAVALKEVRESNYWLRLILATSGFDESIRKGIVELEAESKINGKILGKRIVTTKKNFVTFRSLIYFYLLLFT